LNRLKDTSKKVEPISTCNPWKPVDMKNVDPNLESDILKGASIYSKAWKAVKMAPKTTVRSRELADLAKFPFNI